MNTDENAGAASAEAEWAQGVPERTSMAVSQDAYWQLFQAMAGPFVAWDPAGMRASLVAGFEADADAQAATDPAQDAGLSADPPWGGRESILASQVLNLVQAMAAFAPSAAGLTWVPAADRNAVASQIGVDGR